MIGPARTFRAGYHVLRSFSGISAIVTPTIIERPEHSISRANISPNALKVLYRLKEAGYEAYLVGGGVRDLLLGLEPKDFDVATDATPEEVKAVFRNCRLIGRRFRLAHVHFGREIIEVATFRGTSRPGQVAEGENGMILSDNVYGTLEEDALRRDFTVNALYYNIADFSVVDYAGGVEDLKAGRLRLLGDPETRFREDPVRMLRAARFAAKLGFQIDDDVARVMPQLADLLLDVPPARLFEEVLKLFMAGTAVQCFEHLRHYNLFGPLFPDTEECLAHEEHDFPITLVLKGLENTDRRVNEGKPVTPAFLFAVLLWEPARRIAEQLVAEGMDPAPAMQQASGEIIQRQAQHIAIPKRFSIPMREIWSLQGRFHFTRGKRPQRLLAHPRFRAAYDFLLLRAASGEADPALADWWTEVQQGAVPAPGEEHEQAGGEGQGRRRRRRRPRRRKPAAEAVQGQGDAGDKGEA
jgi:poly(A) polymerase